MTHLVVCGLNYHSSPIAIRERFVIPDSCVQHALEALTKLPHLIEAAILSTCNRTEVYAVVSDVGAGMREIKSFFDSAQSIADHSSLAPNFRLLREDVALHLMRVASGLDSMILGEGQIMSQVKGAHQAALAAGTAGPVLDHLFKLALNCGKRVRSETTLGRRAVSVSSAAVELSRELIGPLKGQDVTVIGAGKMAQICIKHLVSGKASANVTVVNRSKGKFGGCSTDNSSAPALATADFKERHQTAASASLVIVATSASQYLLTFKELLEARSNKGFESSKTLIIDISVPRNVDPRVAEIDGITLKHADDLKDIVKKNIAERESLVGEAEGIIFATLDEFDNWQRSRLVVPTIAGLREKIEAIRREHMSRNLEDPVLSGCSDGKRVEEVSRAIVNQILHHPTVQLKATRDYQVLKQQAEALRTLFSLDPLDAGKKNHKKSTTGGPRPSFCR
ncbi:MAG: glutamyl-tRNA reductase [Candidatus Obscuribacterales bacterium]|nr:glutamyl-tRNA reductase [Candidatus Obscuribacterales bacterium]